MEEPIRYKKDSMKHAKIPYVLVLKRYGGRLAAISAVWFLYDLIVLVAPLIVVSKSSLLNHKLI